MYFTLLFRATTELDAEIVTFQEINAKKNI